MLKILLYKVDATSCNHMEDIFVKTVKKYG